MVNHYGENDLLFDSNAEDECDGDYGSIKSHVSISVGDSLLDNFESNSKSTTLANQKPPPQSLLPSNDEKDNNNIYGGDIALLREEIAGMANLAGPVVLTYFLEMLPSIVTLILVGRNELSIYPPIHDADAIYSNTEGEEYDNDDDARKLRLDAASLAVMFMNVVALSPAYGE